MCSLANKPAPDSSSRMLVAPVGQRPLRPTPVSVSPPPQVLREDRDCAGVCSRPSPDAVLPWACRMRESTRKASRPRLRQERSARGPRGGARLRPRLTLRLYLRGPGVHTCPHRRPWEASPGPCVPDETAAPQPGTLCWPPPSRLWIGGGLGTHAPCPAGTHTLLSRAVPCAARQRRSWKGWAGLRKGGKPKEQGG